MILEVLMETIIPLMMASIIDNGVEAGDIHHIYVMGGCMVIVACISLFAGTMGGNTVPALPQDCAHYESNV